MMAALDTFEITVRGRGSHAAMPECGVDPFTSVAQIIMGLQTIPSRMLSAMDSAVVSVTQVHGGEAWNVIPDSVLVRGTVRSFDPVVQDRVEAAIRSMCSTLAAAHGATATVTYWRKYPPTINSAVETDKAIAAAMAVAGVNSVQFDCQPSMASEDFAFMLQAKPGAYIWIGADGHEPCPPFAQPPLRFQRWHPGARRCVPGGADEHDPSGAPDHKMMVELDAAAAAQQRCGLPDLPPAPEGIGTQTCPELAY